MNPSFQSSQRLPPRAFAIAAVVAWISLAGCVLPSRIDVTRFPRPADENPLQPLLMVTVSDINGMPLPGVEVVLENESGVYPMKFRTTDNGVTRPTVGPGRWRLTVSLQGFRSAQRVITVQSGERCVVRARLRLNDETEGVTVYA